MSNKEKLKENIPKGCSTLKELLAIERLKLLSLTANFKHLKNIRIT